MSNVSNIIDFLSAKYNLEPPPTGFLCPSICCRGGAIYNERQFYQEHLATDQHSTYYPTNPIPWPKNDDFAWNKDVRAFLVRALKHYTYDVLAFEFPIYVYQLNFIVFGSALAESVKYEYL